MPAVGLMNRRIRNADNAFASIRIMEADPAISGSQYKYSLTYLADGKCVIRYDYERGKGEHKHVHDREYPVTFSTLENLIASFQANINLLWR